MHRRIADRCTPVRKWLRLFLGSVLAVAANAQIVPAPRMESVWDGGRVIVCASRSRVLYDFAQGEITPRQLKAPEGSLGLTYGNNAAWVVLKEPRAGSKYSWVVYFSPSLQGWARYAGIQDRSARVTHCYPLDGGLFLLISTPGNPFVLGKQAGPIALGHVNSVGEIEVTSLIDLGIDGGLLEVVKPKGEAASFRLRPGLAYLYDLLLADAPFVRLVDGFALVADRSGLFWVFSGKGRLRRHLRLFPSVTDERLRKISELEHAILGFQPTDDGRILVGSRSETAVLNALLKFPRDESIEGLRNAGVVKENNRQEQASVEAYPALQWWSVDPAGGTITQVDPPLKVRDSFDNPEQINNFTFSFLPSGNLLFGDPKEKLKYFVPR